MKKLFIVLSCFILSSVSAQTPNVGKKPKSPQEIVFDDILQKAQRKYPDSYAQQAEYFEAEIKGLAKLLELTSYINECKNK